MSGGAVFSNTAPSRHYEKISLFSTRYTLENTPPVDTMEKISLFSTRYTLENTPPVDTMKKNKENFIDLNYNVNTVSMARTHCSIPFEKHYYARIIA